MTIKKIIITMFLLSIAITAGCLSKENVASTPATDGSPTGTPTSTATATAGVNTAAGQDTATVSTTDLQKQLEIDKQDPILARRIREEITPRGEILIPINSIPNEFKLYHQELNVYIVGMKINSEGNSTGTIDNRGDKTVKISETSFLLVRKDYTRNALGLFMLNDQTIDPETIVIKPGERKSFITEQPNFAPYEKRLETMILISPIIVEARN